MGKPTLVRRAGIMRILSCITVKPHRLTCIAFIIVSVTLPYSIIYNKRVE